MGNYYNPKDEQTRKSWVMVPVLLAEQRLAGRVSSERDYDRELRSSAEHPPVHDYLSPLSVVCSLLHPREADYLLCIILCHNFPDRKHDFAKHLIRKTGR